MFVKDYQKIVFIFTKITQYKPHNYEYTPRNHCDRYTRFQRRKP